MTAVSPSCRALRGISEILKRVQDDEIPGTAREGVSGIDIGRGLSCEGMRLNYFMTGRTGNP